jgi:hypothetical protein
MSTPTIRVRAAAGVVVTFPQDTIAGPGATHLRLAGARPAVTKVIGGRALELEPAAPADPDIEVPYDAFIRKRLRAGDLVIVDDPPRDTAAPAPTRVTTTAAKE